jgi:predicted nuclease of predicted toxin-antitoxin system
VTKNSVKLLFDNQLPMALARALQMKGIDSLHVIDIRLEAAKDEMIWQYALKNNWIIVSKDKDFVQRAQRPGVAPQILWVRCGNCSKDYLIKKFNDNISAISLSIKNGNAVTELI